MLKKNEINTFIPQGCIQLIKKINKIKSINIFLRNQRIPKNLPWFPQNIQISTSINY